MEDEQTRVVAEQTLPEQSEPGHAAPERVVPEQIVLPEQTVDPGFQHAPADAPTVDITTPGGILRGSIE